MSRGSEVTRRWGFTPAPGFEIVFCLIFNLLIPRPSTGDKELRAVEKAICSVGVKHVCP